MLLAELAQVSLEVAATSARSKKVALLAALFRDAGPDDVPVVIPYLAGRLPQGRIGVGWRSLGDPVEPASEPTLTVTGVDAELTALAAVSGSGSQALRRERLRALFAAATADEQHFLRALLTGEVRQGALDAVAADALARAAEAPPADVRRAVMLAGSLQEVARTLLAEGPGALAAFRLTVGRPVQPMLAHTAASVTEAVDKLGPCAVEEKLDGIRVQVHRDGDRVRAFTRTLDDITDRLPELVTAVAALETGRFILDGEVIALGDDGRPRPFQETAARVGSRRDVAAAAAGVPIVPVFFDALSADGEDLLDLPYTERHTALARLVPEHLRVRRALVPEAGDADARRAAEAFLAETLERGHEGWWSRTWPPPTARAAGAPPGSRSSRCTPWTWWCWPPNGGAAGAPASSPTSTSARAAPTVRSRCSARPSKGSPTHCWSGRRRSCGSWRPARTDTS